MSLCLGTFLKTLVLCKAKNNGATQKEIVLKIMGSVCFVRDKSTYASLNTDISNYVNGKRNFPYYIYEGLYLLDCNYCSIADYFEESVLTLLDPNKYQDIKCTISRIVFEDDSIEDNTIIDLVSNTMKKNLFFYEGELSKLLAGIFIYVLKYTSNLKQNVKYIDENYLKESLSFCKENKRFCVKDSGEGIVKASNSEVKKFCIKHEKTLSLLPLCIVANTLTPLHNNVRSMFTDFCLLSDNEKMLVCKMQGVEYYEIDLPKEMNNVVNYYVSVARDFGFIGINYFWDNAKYLHRALERYSDIVIDEYDPRIFKIERSTKEHSCLFDNEYTTISGYIDYYLLNNNRMNNILDVPMDYMWNVCNLSNCKEKDVTFWICKFIICSSYFILNKTENNYNSKYSYINEELIDTQEDLYYYAIYQMIWIYMNKKRLGNS